jgi:hypothetical protein
MEPMYAAGAVPRPVPAPGEGQELWFETPYGHWRLKAEIEAMRERFPDFRIQADQAMLAWHGRLRSPFRPGESYLVQVRYTIGFPDEPPEVAILSPPMAPDTPHLVMGNRPCLYLPSHGSPSGYDPGRTTATTLVAWTALWIHAYETWLATGAWPGRSE